MMFSRKPVLEIFIDELPVISVDGYCHRDYGLMIPAPQPAPWQPPPPPTA